MAPYLFHIAVDGDVPDREQALLRTAGLYPAGYVAMSSSRNTRRGSCTTFFNVFGADEKDARATAGEALARFGRRATVVERTEEQ